MHAFHIRINIVFTQHDQEYVKFIKPKQTQFLYILYACTVSYLTLALTRSSFSSS
jgi:hypothetical protein